MPYGCLGRGNKCHRNPPYVQASRILCVATCENSRVNIAAAHNKGEGEGFECEGLLVDIEMSKLFKARTIL